MKYFLTIFFLSLCLSHLSAQEKHFVFIQADNKQPFYVSLNGKLYSSTASGYVIIPKLTEGPYNFTVGFAQNAYPEQTFSLTLQNYDLGFDLKNFNEKGWGLFNLQTLDVTIATTGNTNVVAKALSENSKVPEAVISFEKRKDPTPSATTTNTDTLAGNGLVKSGDLKEPVKNDASIELNPKSAENVLLTTTPPVMESVGGKKSEKLTDVKKVSEVTGEDGIRLTYAEGSGKNTDTIHVIIPSSPVEASSPVSNSKETGSRKSADDAPATNSAESAASSKNDLKFLDINMSSKKDTSNVAPIAASIGKVMENSDCKDVATEDDYFKLRKKMLSETSDEKMISDAKKAYRNKCFTTSQIKGLSTLFPSDEGRLRFFDASFVSVADASEYYKLQTEFIDPAFVSRFKALLQ